jgi:hypothetical protein
MVAMAQGKICARNLRIWPLLTIPVDASQLDDKNEHIVSVMGFSSSDYETIKYRIMESVEKS